MNGRSCIFCPNPGLESEEHVFSAAIGGVFTIDIVCKTCNTKLNKLVDEPFNQSNPILYYRSLLSLNRKSRGKSTRKIRNPLKGITLIEDGQRYYFDMHNNQVRKRRSITFSEEEREGMVWKISITADQPAVDDGSAFQAIEKKYGVKMFDLIEAGREVQPMKPSNIELPINTNYFLLKCLKVTYESCSYVIPDIRQDPRIEKMKEIILTGNVNEYWNSLYDAGVNSYCSKVLKLSNYYSDQCHLVYLQKNLDGIIAIVKIFNLVHSVKITNDKSYLGPFIAVLITNDWLNRQCSILGAKLDTFQFTFENSPLIQYFSDVLNVDKMDVFVCGHNGKAQIFNDKNEPEANNVEDLIADVSFNELFYGPIKVKIDKDCSKSDFYLKIKGTEFLIKLISISYHISIIRDVKKPYFKDEN